MKVFFINNGMTHYYNLVLSRLNELPGVELTLIIPAQVGSNIGVGVYQTREHADFRVLELKEHDSMGIYLTFRGLARLLWRERPAVVIATDAYLYTFLFNLPVVLAMKILRIKFILKSIPFMIPTYQDAKLQLKRGSIQILRFPKALNTILTALGLMKFVKFLELYARKIAFNRADAHVNYIDDAFRVYESYGVPKEKIFITRNSPDTDVLLETKRSLESGPPILPPCEYRLVHVGRLIEWKRVDMLLRAFARIKKQFQGAELLIIGTGPLEKQLKELSAQLNITASVRFLGGIFEPELLGRYLMSSTVYVLAGMGGLSINDAMCFGLPVICSRGDGTEKVLVRDEFNGKYFREGDEDDLVEKIIYLFNNTELRRTMGNNSAEIIRNEVNIHTVINGYRKAFSYVCPQRPD